MPTVITKKIGVLGVGGGMDHSSFAAWMTACPADLRAGSGTDQVWRGECYDQGKFTTTGHIGSGIATDATHNIILTCATGESFRDKAGVRTTALNYNATTGSGVAIETNGGGTPLTIQAAYTLVDGLQLKDLAYAGAIACTTVPVTVTNCILDNSGQAGFTIGADSSQITFKNCLVFYHLSSGNAVFGEPGFYNCTLVNTASAGTSVAFNIHYTNLLIVKNCAVFGFATFVTGGAMSASSDYNATDLSSAVTGTHNVTNLTYASQFTNSASDFRAVFGSGLAAGTPDATNAPNDITGLARDATTPYIGAWEATGGGGPAYVAPISVVVKQASNRASRY